MPEQNHRNDPVSQEQLLNRFEGQSIEFFLPVRNPDGTERRVTGRIIRSGYVSRGAQYYPNQMSAARAGTAELIIEVACKLQFSPPVQPVFPALGDGSI